MRHIILLGCFLLGVPAVLSAAGFALASHPSRRAAADPRLLLTAQTLMVAAPLATGGVLRLQVAPAIPGLQRVSLRLPAGVRPPVIRVQAAMAGMPMAPQMARLSRQGTIYRGKLNLPMFGTYRVEIAIPHRRPVTLRVTVPLPGGQ